MSHERGCLKAGIIYQGTVSTTVSATDSPKLEYYIGLCDTTFKLRYANHTASFRHRTKRHATTLSHYIWLLNDKNAPYNINWKILRKCKAFSPSTNRCSLCLNEKLYILFHPTMASLNSRNELASNCRHRKKLLLINS